jgi:hypothetical protein
MCRNTGALLAGTAITTALHWASSFSESAVSTGRLEFDLVRVLSYGRVPRSGNWDELPHAWVAVPLRPEAPIKRGVIQG